MEFLNKEEKYVYYCEDIFKSKYEDIRVLIEKDYSIGFHMQDFYEINIIDGVDGVHYIGQNSVKARNGDVFILPPNIPHGYKGGKGFDVYHLLLSNSFFENYLSFIQNLPNFYTLFEIEPIMRQHSNNVPWLHLNEEKLEKVKAKLFEIRKISSDTYTNCFLKNCKVFTVIATLCEEYSKKLENQNDGKSENDIFFARSIAKIYQNYAEKISIDDLAKIANCSRSAYISKFNKTVGMSPGKFIIEKRLSEAVKLLENPEMPVMRVAEATGFYDSAHFIKQFTLKYGVTPSKFREKSKK